MEPREDKKRKIQEYSPDAKESQKKRTGQGKKKSRNRRAEEQRKERLAKRNERDWAKRRAESVEHRTTRIDKMRVIQNKRILVES